MIKFNSIGQIEHERVPFKDAVTTADTYNGAFGEVVDGKFTVGAQKAYAIMQVECGDNEALPMYPIAKGAHVRTINLQKCKGELIDIYDFPLPSEVKVGDKLESDENGALKVVETPAGVHIEVKKIIGNHKGVVAQIADATV